MTDLERPPVKPARPHFSSGPCVKRPGWTPQNLDTSLLGRSHRAKPGKARIAEATALTHKLLELPKDYRIGIMPASDTGAFEAAMWSMLGARGVEVVAWESFGSGWANDVIKELALGNAKVTEAPYGALPDLTKVDFTRDVIFTWNGTTSGVRVPDGKWIHGDRAGLTFADATSAAFAQTIDWPKIDVATFSFQKALGGEAQHGVLILSPRAVQRLESFMPKRPIPKIFRLAKSGTLIQGIFEGETINTPSMLVIEDYLDALRWAEGIGGLEALIARANANAAVIDRWVSRTTWVKHLAADPKTRSNTSVCLAFDERAVPVEKQAALAKAIAARLEAERAAFDIGAYRDAPPGLRIWCGSTVEASDLEALTPWLDWAFETEIGRA